MKNDALRAFLIFLVVFAFIALTGRAMAKSFLNPGAGGSEVIALIHVEGMILGSATGSTILGEPVADSLTLCDQLYEARDDARVKAVVLRINSPGGSAAASDEIFRAVMAVRAKKPVVVSMSDVAASGGYYIASAGNYLFASASTLTGSIGVIFQLYNWEELAKKVGVQSQTLTAGAYKDIGSPWRDMTPKEREMLEALLKETHDQFIKAVDEGRDNLDEAQVRALATGMIYTGLSAQRAGLVDGIGGLHDALAKARELAKVGEGVPVEEYGVKSLWETLFKTKVSLNSAPPALSGLMREPLTALSQALYLSTTLRDLQVR